MLEVRGLAAGYGDTQVLWDVSLDVADGECVALVGSNGAGKTTLLSTISGLIEPRAGTIAFDGEDITTFGADEVVRRGVVQVPEGRRMFAALSVRENLLLGAYHRKDRPEINRDLDRVYELFPVLKEREKQLAGKLSGGEQQMCAIGRGLMAGPRLLMIDEMSLGLAPVMVQGIVEALQTVNKQGLTILLVEQDVEAALSLATRGYVVEAGEITLSGTSDELRSNPEVRKAYLGI